MRNYSSIKETSGFQMPIFVFFAVQMVVPPGDVSKLSAVDKGDNISHIKYNTTLAGLEEIVAMFSGIDEFKVIELAFEHWNAHCEDLLSDTKIMAKLQVSSACILQTWTILEFTPGGTWNFQAVGADFSVIPPRSRFFSKRCISNAERN
jgi:hypothetical protein